MVPNKTNGFPLSSLIFGAKKKKMNQHVKTRIIAIATDCFRKYGIKNTSMECIADSLSISKRTLYQCFRNKRNLLEECARQYMKENNRLIREMTVGKGSLETIVCICYMIYRLLASLYPAFRKDIARNSELSQILKEEFYPPLYEQGNKLFEQAKTEGLIQAGNDFSLVFLFFENCLLSFSADNMREDKMQFTAFTYTLLTYLSGICTPMGREQLNHISIEISYEKD